MKKIFRKILVIILSAIAVVVAVDIAQRIRYEYNKERRIDFELHAVVEADVSAFYEMIREKNFFLMKQPVISTIPESTFLSPTKERLLMLFVSTIICVTIPATLGSMKMRESSWGTSML